MTEIKLNIDNLSDGERKMLAELVEKGNRLISRVWEPTSEELYWYVGNDGTIYRTSFSDNSYSDKFRYSIGNCFMTQEEAEEYVVRLQVLKKWERLSIEAGSHDLLWDGKTAHWHAVYDLCSKKILCGKNNIYIDHCTYFPTQESVLSAIKEVGEYNVKKYILGVDC